MVWYFLTSLDLKEMRKISRNKCKGILSSHQDKIKKDKLVLMVTVMEAKFPYNERNDRFQPYQSGYVQLGGQKGWILCASCMKLVVLSYTKAPGFSPIDVFCGIAEGCVWCNIWEFLEGCTSSLVRQDTLLRQRKKIKVWLLCQKWLVLRDTWIAKLVNPALPLFLNDSIQGP